MSEPKESLLKTYGIQSVYHYLPLHYLPYIVRTGRLMSKTKLVEHGFDMNHFRTTSKRQDVLRGFETYIHLTSHQCPPILQAKLRGGFPHVAFEINADDIEKVDYEVCRFNIAKTRYFRGAKQEPQASLENGRYYEKKLLPVARTAEEKRALLQRISNGQMVEILVSHEFVLPESTIVTIFDEADRALVERILRAIGIDLNVSVSSVSLDYPRNPNSVSEIEAFIEEVLMDPSWRGNGMEYDRV